MEPTLKLQRHVQTAHSTLARTSIEDINDFGSAPYTGHSRRWLQRQRTSGFLSHQSLKEVSEIPPYYPGRGHLKELCPISNLQLHELSLFNCLCHLRQRLSKYSGPSSCDFTRFIFHYHAADLGASHQLIRSNKLPPNNMRALPATATYPA